MKTLSGLPAVAAGGIPAISSVTGFTPGGGSGDVDFGALTLAGAGGVAKPAGASSISDAGGTGLTITSGFVVPSSNGVSSGTVTFDDATEWTVTTTANAYSARTMAQIVAACDNIGATGGKNVIVRGETLTSTMSDIVDNLNFSSEVVIYGENSSTKIDGGFTIRNAQNVVVRGLEVHRTGASNGAVVDLKGPSQATLDQLTIHGQYHDPLGDYSAGGYANCDGVNTSNSGGWPASVTVKRCKIYDVMEGIVILPAGAVSITDNEIYHTYSDMIKVAPQSGSFTAGIDISRNVGYASVGLSTDAPNPHVDCIQFTSGAVNDGQDITNVTIRQNVFWENQSLSRGLGNQGIVAFNDGGYNCVLKNAVVSGNVLLISGNHHITMQAIDGGTFENNTMTHPDPSYTNTASVLPNASLTVVSGGATPTVRYNINEAVNDYGSNDVVIGSKGATSSFASVFDGPTFVCADFDEVKTKFNMKANGPADRDTSGGASAGDAGALGSGFGTYGDVRDPTGWSIP